MSAYDIFAPLIAHFSILTPFFLLVILAAPFIIYFDHTNQT